MQQPRFEIDKRKHDKSLEIRGPLPNVFICLSSLALGGGERETLGTRLYQIQ